MSGWGWGDSIIPSWPSFTQLLLRTANSMHLKYMIGCWTCMCHDTCFHINTKSCADCMNAIKSKESFWKVFAWCVNAVNNSEYWTWQKRLCWIRADDGLPVHFERTAWENMRSNVSSIPWKDENDAPLLFRWSGPLGASFVSGRRFLKANVILAKCSPESEGQQKAGVSKKTLTNMLESGLGRHENPL